MAQTVEGAAKVAAARLSIPLAEYERRRAAGQKWCYRCRDWQPTAEFSIDRARSDGLTASCRESRNRNCRERYTPRPVPVKGRRFVEARADDRLQARRRVNYLVEAGLIPRPGDLACVDCGHEGDGPRHEYDHHNGYAPEHHEDVVPLCSGCHYRREAARAGKH